jgi:NAD(P)-dependent dehydrogenase (short-subunit alcohol dehydrogenase family)
MITYAVTGGNSGVGYRLISKLIKQHSTTSEPPLIFMCCRNRKKANDAIRNILSSFITTEVLDDEYDKTYSIHPSKWIEFISCDLTDFKSVHSACKEIESKVSTLILFISM